MQIPAHASLVPREYNIFIWKYQRKYDTMGKLYQIPSGEVAEWSKAPVSKTGRGETSSRVRISPSPPVQKIALWAFFVGRRGTKWTASFCARDSKVGAMPAHGQTRRGQGKFFAVKKFIRDRISPSPQNETSLANNGTDGAGAKCL